MIAQLPVVGYCVFPFMHGALASLVAFVLSGLAPAAPTPAGPSMAAVCHAAAVAACAGDAVPELESPADEPIETPTVLGLAPSARQDLATPAEIGCALVFRNTAAVDHASALHMRASAAGEVRLWSCDESALRVFNAWYRVSRFPEAESSRALSLQASHPASALAHLDGSRAALTGGTDLHRANEAFFSGRAASASAGPTLIPPPSRLLALFATTERPPFRTLPALERPPRAVAR